MEVDVRDAEGLLKELDSLVGTLTDEQKSAQTYKDKVAEAEKAQAKAIGNHAKRAKAARQLAGVLKKLDKQGKLTAEQRESAEAKLLDAQDVIQDIEQIKPSTGSIFVRLFLGQVNVKATTSKDRTLLRDEYDKFKDRTNIGFLLFPLIWILTFVYLRHKWRYTHWIHILTHVWLLYYYVSLSLRENILRVNGSSIRPWWIYHHYVSSAMSILVLTWPADSRSWDRFMPTFTAYFLFQGAVQFVQARYQRARHYARRAMGKANHMDVSHTETLTEFHAGLYIIVVLVFIAQAWQIYNGIALIQVLTYELNFSQPWYDFREEVQCGMLGVLFLFLGITNFVVTVQTLLDKSARSAAQASARQARLQRQAARSAAAASAANGPSALQTAAGDALPDGHSGPLRIDNPNRRSSLGAAAGGDQDRSVSRPGSPTASRSAAASPASSAGGAASATTTGTAARNGFSPMADGTLISGPLPPVSSLFMRRPAAVRAAPPGHDANDGDGGGGGGSEASKHD